MNIFPFAVCVFILCCACKKNELPEETIEGNNSFAMLVDGEIWKPFVKGGQLMPAGSPLNFYYNEPKGELEIIADNFETDERIYLWARINADSNSFFTTHFIYWYDTVYTCVDTTRFQIGGQCNSAFKLKDVSSSSIDIIKLDTVNNIIAGRFAMRLQTSEGDIMELTKGRFDLKYMD